MTHSGNEAFRNFARTVAGLNNVQLAEMRQALSQIPQEMTSAESGGASFRLEQLPPHSLAIALPPRG